TLKMLVDRGEAISHFKKEKYYHVRLDLSGAKAVNERISDKQKADTLKAACEAETAVCVSLTKEKKTREANKIYGYTAKQTLDLAQTLYKKRLLTYPRTDSSYLTGDMGDTAAKTVAMLSGKLPFMEDAEFTLDVSRTLDSSKVSDHHAIIPTMELAKTDLAALPESERNILKERVKLPPLCVLCGGRV
ncbi:MAG: DNA topoisomerase III, partial [Lachnospiraceae bacterium]|nr:DNA topoisomerase III [Lachnospiraceae bacterium]